MLSRGPLVFGFDPVAQNAYIAHRGENIYADTLMKNDGDLFVLAVWLFTHDRLEWDCVLL